MGSGESLRRYLAISAGLVHARALVHWAEYQRTENMEAGKGEAACNQAAALLRKAASGGWSCLNTFASLTPWLHMQAFGLFFYACVLIGALLFVALHAAAQGFPWLQQIERELSLVEACRLLCEQDRERVYHQAVAKAIPELPASKVLAKAVPWSPEQPLASSALHQT